MKDIYTIIEENNIEKTDAMYEYMSAYQNCWMLINEKFEFPDFKKIFKKKDSSAASNSVSSSFSFLSFLLGGRSSNADTKDPVREAYMKTLEEKRKNNEARRKELIKGQQDIKIRNIKLKAKQEEAKIASAHQEMMNQIKATTDALDKELANMDKIIASIKSGKPIQADILDDEITRQNKIVDAMIKASPDNDFSKQEAAQAAFMQLYYKKNDNGELVARTPDEFKQKCTDDPATAKLFTDAAAEGENFIDNATEQDLADMAKSFDMASQTSQQAAATESLKEATEKAAVVAEVAAAVEKETSDASKRNELRGKVKDAKEKNDKANTEYKNLKDLNKQQQMMYSFINKNKGKEPLKSILKKEGVTATSLATDLGGDCIDDVGKINAANLSEKLGELATGTDAPTETREGATSPSLKYEFSIDNQTIKLEDAQKAVNSAIEVAATNVANTESELNSATNELKNAGGDAEKLENEPIKLSDETTKRLNKLGIKNTDDLNLVKASVKNKVDASQTAITNAQKAIDIAKDNDEYLRHKYEEAEKTLETIRKNENPDVKETNKKINDTYKSSGINPVVEKKDGNRVYVEYTDKDGKTQKMYRPTDLSDTTALDEYNSKRKLALVKAAAEGNLKEPVESHIEMIGGEPHYFVDNEDLGSDANAKDLYVSAQVEAKIYSRDMATVKNILKVSDKTDSNLSDEDEQELIRYIDDNSDALDKIASEIDGISAKELEDLMNSDSDEDDDEAINDDEKILRDTKKILKDKSEDEILALAGKDEKPENISDEEWDAAKKYKAAKDKLDADDENSEDSDEDSGKDETGKPKEPKRKIRKKAGKRKGSYQYIYKTNDGKIARASKKDWQANVRAWKKYKRRLSKWQKNNPSKNESFITKVLSKKLVIERFCPKDLTSYLKECFE